MLQEYSEKIYTVEDYCFSVVRIASTFTVSICSRDDYENTNVPEFCLVDIYNEADGYTEEKILEMIQDKDYLFSAMQSYISILKDKTKSKKIEEETIEDRVVEAVKKVVSETDAVCWTLEEASRHSRIGINALRSNSLREGCPWVLWVGETKRLVKVDAFKKWVLDTYGLDIK